MRLTAEEAVRQIVALIPLTMPLTNEECWRISGIDHKVWSRTRGHIPHAYMAGTSSGVGRQNEMIAAEWWRAQSLVESIEHTSGTKQKADLAVTLKGGNKISVEVRTFVKHNKKHRSHMTNIRQHDHERADIIHLVLDREHQWTIPVGLISLPKDGGCGYTSFSFTPKHLRTLGRKGYKTQYDRFHI